MALPDDSKAGSSAERTLEAALSEYTQLSEEIGRRSTAQQALVTVNATVIGAIGGFALARHQPVLLVLLPVLSAALGLLWLDHARSIRSKGVYIGDVLAPVIWTASAPSVFLNEKRTREDETHRAWRLISLTPLFAFALACVASLFIASDTVIVHNETHFKHIELRIGVWAALLIGLVLTIGFIAAMIAHLRAPGSEGS